MLVSMKHHVPELFTGLIGVAFILALLWSSIKHKRQYGSVQVSAWQLRI